MSDSVPNPGTVSINVVMPAHNSEDTLEECLAALIAAGFAVDEITVVDDGSTDRTGDIAHEFGVHVLRNEKAERPAAARNKGAARVKADVMLFVDADVCVATDIRGQIEMHLSDPKQTGVIGSYDNAPRSKSLVGRYRNLLHAHTHQNSAGDIPTFWTGLGAVRRDAFEQAGGFLSAWENIEDVEFGLRVTHAGGRLILDPRIQGKHLKDWSIASMFKTDMLGRAAPWTRLLKSGRMPMGVLSTSREKRVSAAAIAAALFFGVVGMVWPMAFLFMAASILLFAVANASFLNFLRQIEGSIFAAAAFPLHMLHHVAALCGYAKVMLFERITAADG